MNKPRTKLLVMARVTLLVLITALVSPALADSEFERATLKGLTGVNVLVEKLHADVEREGLAQSTLRTDVELKLRQAGIRVLTEKEMLATPTRGAPYLYLTVGATKGTGTLAGVYSLYIRLELRQSVILERNPSITSVGVTTWDSTAHLGIVPVHSLSAVRGIVRDAVDEFINAYLAANPKQ